jgi:threonine dehydrogenase-like Zn-dependent dehydrogenase
LVSFPFVPGHEVVGTVETPTASADGTTLDAGSRVVIQPVLGCVARGIEPPCRSCAAGRTGDCEHVAFGHIAPGIQTGFCADTGGGWSAAGLVAHESQIFAVPDPLSDADAVTVEPVACALHAVLGAGVRDDDVVAVLGAGTLGLATLAALTHLASTRLIPAPKAVLVGARYANQRALASELGATAALNAEQLSRAIRRHSRSMTMSGADGARLTGGADVVFDCVGSADSIGQSLEMVRPRGTIVLVGMPGKVSIDLAPLWHREIRLAGAYAYGTESVGTHERSTFSLAIDTVTAMRTGRLVSATYPLDRFEEAVAHAGAAGRRGAVKIAFDLRATSKGGRR